MANNTDNQVRATAKYVRMAPRKVRMVVDQIRNKSVEQALEVVGVDGAIGGGLHLHNLKSAYRSTGRVGSMSTIGYNDTGTLGVATQ